MKFLARIFFYIDYEKYQSNVTVSELQNIEGFCDKSKQTELHSVSEAESDRRM